MVKEKRLFEQLINIIKEQKVAMIERDLEKMNSLSEEMEEVLFEVDKVDGERHRLFTIYKRRLGLDEDASFEEFLNKIDGEGRAIFIETMENFLFVLNELAAELQGMKEMMRFEKSYFDFVVSLLSDSNDRSIYKGDGRSYTEPGKKVLDVRW